MTEKLTNLELDLVFFIERFAAQTGNPPTDAQVKARFNNITESDLKAFKQNSLVQKSFKHRGITYPSASDVLTDNQMHAISVMCDPYDRRSDEKKLRDIGVTTRQWSMWLLDDEFARYLNDRAEKLLERTTFEAHKGVLKGARNGNVAAAKLHYEITGRYRPNEEQQIDVRRILHTFIEIIQKYVKDPIVLHAIAMDLSAAGSAESLSTSLSNSMTSNVFGPAHDVRSRSLVTQVQQPSLVPIPPPIGEADDD